MNIINRLLRRAAAFACLLTLAAGFSGNAFATTVSKTVQWTGQGVTADGSGGYDLNTELCGVANGADAPGPYLLWVLTASGATNATITGPWGTLPMFQSGNGTFKFISGWYEPASLLTPPGVSATYYYSGRPPANPQLVISHGCRPFTGTGAWCSPGFWRNALNVPVPNAWTFINVSPGALFNDTVVPDFYADLFAADPTLQTVLQNPQTYSGPGDLPLGLNAYNATGAYLTSQLPPPYFFDPTLIGSVSDDDACPIDHFGHLKQPTN